MNRTWWYGKVLLKLQALKACAARYLLHGLAAMPPMIAGWPCRLMWISVWAAHVSLLDPGLMGCSSLTAISSGAT